MAGVSVKAALARTHSKTLRVQGMRPNGRQVLECVRASAAVPYGPHLPIPFGRDDLEIARRFIAGKGSEASEESNRCFVRISGSVLIWVVFLSSSLRIFDLVFLSLHFHRQNPKNATPAHGAIRKSETSFKGDAMGCYAKPGFGLNGKSLPWSRPPERPRAARWKSSATYWCRQRSRRLA